MAERKASDRAIPPRPEPRRHARRLLAWYGRARRELPWRAPPGASADPYRVWLSEIMLQQTTVAAVIPYFERFTSRWPDVGALAAASLDAVLAEWQGLGYYARARNLARCARIVAGELDGAFPATEEGLRRLPGIGPYTAAAIAAIAFGRRAAVIDGNVERVIARLFAVDRPLPGAKPRLAALAAALTPRTRPGDYAQAMMDLGATVCTPTAPDCAACPVAPDCRARALGVAADLPRRAPRKARPVRRGTAWFCVNGKGEVLLRRRPERGLLGGLWEVPSSDWNEEGASHDAALPVPARWRTAGEVAHVFTHFRLELSVRVARIARGESAAFGPETCWVSREELESYALPTVMKKVIAAGAEATPIAGRARK